MKLSDAQFGCLVTLEKFGPKTAVEVDMPQKMDGTRRARLEWHVASSATLGKLEAAGFVRVVRRPASPPINAVGKRGRKRTILDISITDAGRVALRGKE